MDYIAQDIALMNVSSKVGAIVSFESHRDNMNPGTIASFGKHEIQQWGNDNLLPQRREALVRENNIIPQLLQTKRDILIGSGIVPFKKEFEDGKSRITELEMPAEIEDWLEATDWDSFIMRSCSDLLMHANFFTEFIRTRDRKKISSISAKKAKHVRLKSQTESGNVTGAYWCGNWKKASTKGYKPIYIPFDTSVRPGKFLKHYGDPLIDYDEYYFDPAWWGGREWIELSNAIPEFHIANLKNGFNIRFHVKVPKDYFKQYSSESQVSNIKPDDGKNKQAIADARQQLMDRINNWLAGQLNAGRAFFSSYRMSMKDGKEFGGIIIEPIKYDMKDEALIKLFEKSNEANMSSQGVHPTLANIQTQGKLSSGSEIRNAFLMYVAIKTPVPRKQLLKPLNLVARTNGWFEKYNFKGFMFKDIEITKLDDDKAAKKEIAIPNE